MAGVKGRSGGARVGAGRKPLNPGLRVLHGGRRKNGEAPTAVRVPAVVAVPMPDGLTEEERAVWALEAPHAIQARTLTPGTAAEFADFCRTVVRERLMWRQVERDGWTHLKVTVDGSGQEHQELKAHPLISRATTLTARVEQKRVKFKLAPIGKEMIPPEQPRDEWAEFDADAAR